MPSVRITALGTPLDLVGSDEAVAEVTRDWSRCVVPHADGAPATSMTIGERSTTALTSRVTRAAIDGLAGRRVLLHAAGLSTDGGRVLVLVGPSGTGKTTACLALCRSEFGYATDETVAIDEHLQITAYPKPLLLRRSQTTPKDVVSPDELGLATHPERLTAHRIVLLRRDGTSPARLDQMPLVDGLLALIPETSALARLPHPLDTLARTVEACGGVHALHYTEIEDAGTLLTRLMADDAPPVERWQHEVVPQSSTPDDAALGDTLVATVVDDAIRVHDEVLALRDGRPVRLQGIGSTIWTSAIGGLPAAEVRSLVEQVHGEHPDADRLVAAAIDEMLAQGVLARA